MVLDSFLHMLHFDIDKLYPPDWEVDWEDAPLAYKLYRGLPVFPLSSEVPLHLDGNKTPSNPDLNDIGHFLWYVYGITQFCESFFSTDSMVQSLSSMTSYRRFVPSGGALYPNELYMYLKMKDLPAGVYHYDVAHHRLVLLREGDFDDYINRAIGNRCDLSACFGAVFVSTQFWKNFFKYNNFSYRLQGLDAGVLIGQLLEVAKRFGYASGVCFQFIDRAVNHLLGLSEREESVYAVIPLSVVQTNNWFGNKVEEDNINCSAASLCRDLPEIRHQQYIRSRKLIDYPMLIRMNEASMLESIPTIPTIRQIGKRQDVNCEGETIHLPKVDRLDYDFTSVCRNRYSPGMDFVYGKVSKHQLAALFQEASKSFMYRNDLDGVIENSKSRVLLYGCLHHIDGIPNGAYQYDSVANALRAVNAGDHRIRLQQGMSMQNVDLFQVPICLHVAGDRNHFKEDLGYRGHRIQQMEAGMLVQRLLLAASAIGMGGHPLLGYDVSMCDELYKMDSKGLTSLIQIPVGHYRISPRLQGGLHE